MDLIHIYNGIGIPLTYNIKLPQLLTSIYYFFFTFSLLLIFVIFLKFHLFENISSGDGLVYPLQSQHLPTVYESLRDSPSSRIDIDPDKNTMESNSKPSETVLIDVTAHTENSRNKSSNVLSS